MELLKNIHEFDEDDDGTLSRDELAKACKESPQIESTLLEAGVNAEDVEVILDALESESDNGDVSYVRFVNLIHEIEAADMRKLIVRNHLATSQELSQHARALQSNTEMLERVHANVKEIMAKSLGQERPAAPARSALKGALKSLAPSLSPSPSRISSGVTESSADDPSPSTGHLGQKMKISFKDAPAIDALLAKAWGCKASTDEAFRQLRHWVEDQPVDVAVRAQAAAMEQVNEVLLLLEELRRTDLPTNTDESSPPCTEEIAGTSAVLESGDLLGGVMRALASSQRSSNPSPRLVRGGSDGSESADLASDDLLSVVQRAASMPRRDPITILL